MAKNKFRHPICGRTVLRVCTDVHPNADPNTTYILLSGGYIIKCTPQDMYSYHDCSPSAKEVSVTKDPDVCMSMILDRTNYKDVNSSDL